MATITIQPMEFSKTLHGGPEARMKFKEAASQTFKAGAVLVLDASGYVAEATSGSPSSTRIVGVALEPGHSGTAGQYECLVALANDTNVFVANGDATATAQGNVGMAYNIEKSGSNWVIDLSAGVQSTLANKRVIILEHDPRDAVGDTSGRLAFIFHPAACGVMYTS